jgi:hypothetical protein
MAVDPSVLINLAAEYTGKPAFDKAEKSTFNLQKSVKKLATTFGLAFGTTAVVNFSKQAVKAFAQDEAAAIRLNRAVENLGIGFANPAITKYIAELERSAAIADDILRPAFQGLLTTTGSLTKSQELLNNAITISRASGIDLATVSQDLANGYVGITKGLKKYNTGLTTAELSSKSFAEVLGVLLTRSAGSATDYLDTTQFKMDALTIATGNASEIIGGGLVNAFARIGGGTEASDAAKAIEDIATAVAFTTEKIGGLIGVIPMLLENLKNLPKDIFGGFAGAAAGRKITPNPVATPKKTPVQISQEQQAKALAKLEADAIKRQKAILALQKKQTDASKKAAADQAKLTKAQSIFDLDKIQIEAALKGKVSADEKLRLELQRAILNEDFKLAENLQKRLEASQRATAALQGQISAIKPPVNPFAETLTTLELIAELLGKVSGATVRKPGGGILALEPDDLAPLVTAPKVIPKPVTPEPVPVVVIPSPTPTPSTNNPFAGLGGDMSFNRPFSVPGYSYTPSAAPDVTVNVTVTGSVIAQQDLVKVVNDAVVEANTQGLSTVRPGGLGFRVDEG